MGAGCACLKAPVTIENEKQNETKSLKATSEDCSQSSIIKEMTPKSQTITIQSSETILISSNSTAGTTGSGITKTASVSIVSNTNTNTNTAGQKQTETESVVIASTSINIPINVPIPAPIPVNNNPNALPIPPPIAPAIVGVLPNGAPIPEPMPIALSMVPPLPGSGTSGTSGAPLAAPLPGSASILLPPLVAPLPGSAPLPLIAPMAPPLPGSAPFPSLAAPLPGSAPAPAPAPIPLPPLAAPLPGSAPIPPPLPGLPGGMKAQQSIPMVAPLPGGGPPPLPPIAAPLPIPIAPAIKKKKEAKKKEAIEEEEEDYKIDPEKEKLYCSSIMDLKELNHYASISGLAKRTVYKNQMNVNTPNKTNFKKVMKEIKTSLPENITVSWNGSMFVRFDEDNPRFLQTILTGLIGTPYENGIFIFDIYLGDNYPTSACKIQHTTKGGTLVTANNGPGGFSPNLHKSTGKVCLSLLGTWSTGAQWDPKRSSVYQVLSTILWMIFGAKWPYYNEPGHGGWEGTAPTKNHQPRVKEYNEELYYGTTKYGILDVLKNPYVGFEDVIKMHFKLKKDEILNRIENKWIKNGTKKLKDKLNPLLKELKIEFEKLDNYQFKTTNDKEEANDDDDEDDLDLNGSDSDDDDDDDEKDSNKDAKIPPPVPEDAIPKHKKDKNKNNNVNIKAAPIPPPVPNGVPIPPPVAPPMIPLVPAPIPQEPALNNNGVPIPPPPIPPQLE